MTGLKKAVIWGCSLLLFEIQKEMETATVKVDFAKKELYLDLNWLYRTKRDREMLKDKNLRAGYGVLVCWGIWGAWNQRRA